MNEKRSSIVGFALIGIILLLFSWYNTRQFNKRQQEELVRDSLATAAAIANGEMAASADSAYLADEPLLEEENDYQDLFLNQASQAETAWYTLENDKLAIQISSKGAQPYEVRIKDYYT